MAIIKCKMCGGDLNLIEGASTAECEYCGSVQTVPKVDDEKKLTLFARANRLRAACEFDKAAGIYESIVADFPEEAEAYWGLLLCKYGIEYVDDPGTGKKIPTCHRSSFQSVLDDTDLEQAMENADSAAQKVYREEAKQFERIRKGILEVSSTEKPYDIFICYKETAENGDRTLDSVLAQDLYSALTDKGYRVFFSRITLQGKLGEAYEPYIFAALNSAKVMLAVGTCYEHYNAVWVKNEWSRYLKICAADKSKHLIPCYKDIDPEDMPKEFNHLQGADLGKMGAVQDILFNMEKYIPLKKETVVQVTQTTTAANPTVESYLKRATMALEDGEWDRAEGFFEEVLNHDPERAEAYLGLAMCRKRLNTLEALVAAYDWENNYYRRGKQFADASLSSQIHTLEQAYLTQKKIEEDERLSRVASFKPLREQAQRLSARLASNANNTLGLRADGTVVATGLNEDGQRNVDQWADIIAICVGYNHAVGLKADGTVLAVGCNYDDRCNVDQWTDITNIATSSYHTVGLKRDGTVVATGDNKKEQCSVSGWTNVIAIAANDYHTVGLKKDGTVVATGQNEDGQCNVDQWTDIVAICAGYNHTVGLKADGTVVATGYNKDRQCNVSGWKNVVQIAADDNHTVGLKADGTVVAVGLNDFGQCNVSDWTDIVAIAANFNTVGLKADGTVVAVGDNEYGWCNVSHWTNVAAINASYNTIGLKADGTVVASGDNKDGQCDVSDWKLFQSIDTIEQEWIDSKKKHAEEHRIREEDERIAREKREEEARIAREEREKQSALQAQRRSAGLCQHCGGQLKGLFSKKCVRCGKPKDY